MSVDGAMARERIKDAFTQAGYWTEEPLIKVP
jgi:hypothetical protein